MPLLAITLNVGAVTSTVISAFSVGLVALFSTLNTGASILKSIVDNIGFINDVFTLNIGASTKTAIDADALPGSVAVLAMLNIGLLISNAVLTVNVGTLFDDATLNIGLDTDNEIAELIINT